LVKIPRVNPLEDVQAYWAGSSARNAETLPFPDGQFDLVYSWGVIHHTPDMAAAAREIARVCRPGGRVCRMVCNRRSLFALQGRLVYGCLRGKPGRPIEQIAAAHFESPGTRLSTKKDLLTLFPGFRGGPGLV
jgi:SAM-dependent methyltransferase